MRDWAAKWQQRSGDIEKLREVWAEARQVVPQHRSISTTHLPSTAGTEDRSRTWRLSFYGRRRREENLR